MINLNLFIGSFNRDVSLLPYFFVQFNQLVIPIDIINHMKLFVKGKKKIADAAKFLLADEVKVKLVTTRFVTCNSDHRKRT